MSITDPGNTFAYLTVKSHGKEFFVRKSCRALRYEPFWETEPVPGDSKPDVTLLASDVPPELWEIMSTEERLMCHLAEARSDIRKLRRRNANLVGVLVLVIAIGWTFAVLLFSR